MEFLMEDVCRNVLLHCAASLLTNSCSASTDVYHQHSSYCLSLSLSLARAHTHTNIPARSHSFPRTRSVYTKTHGDHTHTHTHTCEHTHTRTRISQTSTPINLAATQTNKQTNNPPTDLTATIYHPAGRSWSWGRNYLADNKGKTVKRRLTVIADVITYFLSIKHGAGGPRSQLWVDMSDRNSFPTQR